MSPVFSAEAFRSFYERQRSLNAGAGSEKRGEVKRPGSRRGVPDWLMPTELESFAGQYGECLGKGDARQWVEEHTIAPFFSATLSPKQAIAFQARLLRPRNGPRRPKLAIAPSEWLEPSPTLCPTCDDDFVAQNGFSIVLRHWLLPFLTRCPLHSVSLENFPHWTPLSRGPSGEVKRSFNRESLGVSFSVECYAALESKEGLLEELGHLLQSRGFTTPGGRIRREALCNHLVSHARGRYEHAELSRLLESPTSVSALLRPLCTPRGALHPAIGVALLVALRDADESPQQAISSPARIQKTALLEVTLKRCRTLSEAARQAGVSVTTAAVYAKALGVEYLARPKLVDDACRSELEHLLSCGMAVPPAAKKAGVSLSSAYRVLKSRVDIAQRRKSSKEEWALRGAQRTWKKVVLDNPAFTKSELRAAEPAAYTLLYRKDRAWLSLNSPAPKAKAPRGNSPSRIPDGAHDQLLARLHAARDTDGKERTPRFTATRLLFMSGRKHQGGLSNRPDLELELKGIAESLAEFVRRRLSAAVARLHNEERLISVAAVERESGLRPETIALSGVNMAEVMCSTKAFNFRSRA